jgi:hypothetical protein
MSLNSLKIHKKKQIRETSDSSPDANLISNIRKLQNHNLVFTITCGHIPFQLVYLQVSVLVEQVTVIY